MLRMGAFRGLCRPRGRRHACHDAKDGHGRRACRRHAGRSGNALRRRSVHVRGAGPSTVLRARLPCAQGVPPFRRRASTCSPTQVRPFCQGARICFQRGIRPDRDNRGDVRHPNRPHAGAHRLHRQSRRERRFSSRRRRTHLRRSDCGDGLCGSRRGPP